MSASLPWDPSSLRLVASQGEAIHIPRPLTTFVGRASETEAVRLLLSRDDVRLVTLTGPGGVGKTRLAIRAAQTLDEFGDGVWFVPLESCRDPSQVPTIIASTLGITTGTTHVAEPELVTVLASRRVLLVLDNLEQVGEIGPWLVSLLSACPRLKILGTSRAPLRVSGEHVFAVGPLAVPGPDDPVTADHLAGIETVALFVERARASDANFALTQANAATVAAICGMLDGLPLAVELAAARVAMLPLPLLLAKLGERLTLLTNGPHDAPTRQQTMANTIAWSYDLLSPDQQELFQLLGVFSGGFTLEAAISVAGMEERTVVDGVMALVTCHLVVSTSGRRQQPRFLMLETIRDFALQRLHVNGNAAAVHRTHALFFARFAEEGIPQYDGPNLPSFVDRINDDLPNYRLAMGWSLAEREDDLAIRLAGAICRVWFYPQATGKRAWRNRLDEGRKWLDASLQHRDGWPIAILTEALMGSGLLGLLQGDLTHAEDRGKELFARAEAEHYAYGLYWAHWLLGCLAGERSAPAAARTHFAQALAIAPTIRDPANQQAFTLMYWAELEQRNSRPDQAFRLFSSALEHNAESENPCIRSHCTRSLGALLVDRGDEAAAIPMLREALAIDLELDQLPCVAESLLNLATAAIACGREDVAGLLLGRIKLLPVAPEQQPELNRLLALIQELVAEDPLALAMESGQQATWPALFGQIDVLAVAENAGCRTPPAKSRRSNTLSRRELEVVRLLAEGQSNREIAETLCLSQRTIENHVLHILAKLNLNTRTAVAAFAIRQGIA